MVVASSDDTNVVSQSNIVVSPREVPETPSHEIPLSTQLYVETIIPTTNEVNPSISIPLVMETSNQQPILREPSIYQVLMDAIDATTTLEQNESVVQVTHVGIANQGEADHDVMMEEVAADESMEEDATAFDAQLVNKGKKVMEMGGTS
ncbi:hypothetical protein L6452_28092 [Arctium lappa]|uniref:Uncharacterized protein n=1 Tax=Arctium lappa TaxID=4217 RepID=A0ACB8ZYH1_ARCLA|nr:hypothetical protein L6452_28092 [Arctium lappa]